jgi:alkylhydroperoxidase family enzyme
VLANWRTARVDPKVRATLGLLEKLVLAPAAVCPADLAPLRAASVSDAAIEDAIQVCALFSIFNRLADSFSFHLHGPGDYAALGGLLLKRGYRV